MTQEFNSEIELKIQKGIRQAEDSLVILIQDALDTKTSYGDLQESQFRNLVRVSDTTESPEVVKNFLRYQVGRDKKWGRGRNSLAEKIILHIGQKSKEPEQKGKILPLAEKIAEDAGTKDVDRIWIELIRRYLGYGARYLKYLNDGQN
ncbi:hypothetical protein ACN4EK_06340 [Pantanalinema rosaneae CENA516]|uniref:hypothetical protein n=1 Tax=Pantanalinema rosaneae TaxID=1620701 RepID=UPI003D6EF2AB